MQVKKNAGFVAYANQEQAHGKKRFVALKLKVSGLGAFLSCFS